MSQSEGGSGSSIDFLSTHPANARRIKVGPNVSNGPNSPNFFSLVVSSYLLFQIPCRSFYPRISSYLNFQIPFRSCCPLTSFYLLCLVQGWVSLTPSSN